MVGKEDVMTPASKAAATKKVSASRPPVAARRGAGEEECVRRQGGAGGQEGHPDEKYSAHKESRAHQECSAPKNAQVAKKPAPAAPGSAAVKKDSDADQEGGSHRQEGRHPGQEDGAGLQAGRRRAGRPRPPRSPATGPLDLHPQAQAAGSGAPQDGPLRQGRQVLGGDQRAPGRGAGDLPGAGHVAAGRGRLAGPRARAG